MASDPTLAAMSDNGRAGEPPLQLALSALRLDRMADRREDPARLEEAISDPRARVLDVADASAVRLAPDGSIAWRPIGTDAPGDLLLLGRDGAGRPLFAAHATGSDPGPGYVALREAALGLSAEEAAAAFHAVALAAWHQRTPFCASCGGRTRVIAAGHLRRCEDCGTRHFPRTDPAVIMLVRDEDRCVLGRRVGAPAHRWSTLAGFVEPGESLEDAVVREVYEEVGLRVDAVRYTGSQPWPFPASLMVAFEAEAAYAPLRCNDEHSAVAWFTRGELRAAISDGRVAIPGPISAGYYLIQRWLADGEDHAPPSRARG